MDDAPPLMRDRHLTARKDMTLVRDASQVALSVKLGTEQVVDARGPGRFSGEEPEPREGLRSGHIPGSKNVHSLITILALANSSRYRYGPSSVSPV